MSTKKGAKGEKKSLIFRTFGIKFNEEEFNKHFSIDSKANGEDKENANHADQKNANQKVTNGDAKKTDDTPMESDFSQMLFNRFAEYKVINAMINGGLTNGPTQIIENNLIFFRLCTSCPNTVSASRSMRLTKMESFMGESLFLLTFHRN